MSALLDEVKRLSLPHANAVKEPLDAWFSRMLHEQMRGRQLPTFDPALPFVRLTDDHVDVQKTTRPLHFLVRFTRFHKILEPGRCHEPLILFGGHGGVFLIDGSKRINKWEADDNEGPHPVLIVKPRIA